jgi:acyl carrier protein
MHVRYRGARPEKPEPMKHDICLAVRRFIGENFLFRDDGDAITHDASLLDAGIIDSTGVLELVSFLETTFGIEVQDDEMLPENLDSIRAIASYVGRKLESSKVQMVA